MPDQEPDEPPTLNYASPGTHEPAMRIEHYVALFGLVLATGLFALLMLALGISAAVAWMQAGSRGHLDMGEVQIACFIDLPLGVFSAGVCTSAYRKLRQ